MKKRSTAIVLAWFLGGFGGQKFYLGKTGAGVVSILFFWTLIPAFIAVYDIIKFACMSNEDFDKQYNTGA